MGKPYTKSKTVWGIVIIVLSCVLMFFGIDVDLSPIENGLALQEALMVLGAILTAIGIRMADKPLGKDK